MRLRPLTTALLAASLAGCYTYVPVETPSPGTTVRVVVPVQTGVEGRRSLPETTTFEGTVVSSSDTLVLEARTVQELDAFNQFTAVDTLRVARSRILEVGERRLSRGRTTAFTVGSLAAVALFVVGVQQVAGGSDGDGPPDNGTPASHVIRDILRFRVPLPGG